MSQPSAVITHSQSDTSPAPPALPSHRLMSISSGPMSEGMIPSVSAGQDGKVKKRNESSEHICMFSVCLMFIGVPIIVVGILCISVAAPFGIILTMIGVGASVSGAILVILSGLITLFKSCIKSKPKVEYIEEQSPEIIIEDTLYCEHFRDNLCQEQSEQNNTDLADLPNMEQLDPVYWSNYPEAQNPKSYLQSFGDLPKVIPSPANRSSSAKTTRFDKKPKKKKIARKLSQSLGMGHKHKTMSKTSLTRDFNEEIHSDSSASLSSTSSDSTPEGKANTQMKISANGFGVKNNNQSIITIENAGHNLSEDHTEEEMTATLPSNDKTSNHISLQKTADSSADQICVTEEQNNLVVNGSLHDECIELTEIRDRNEQDKQQDRYGKDQD